MDQKARDKIFAPVLATWALNKYNSTLVRTLGEHVC